LFAGRFGRFGRAGQGSGFLEYCSGGDKLEVARNAREIMSQNSIRYHTTPGDCKDFLG